MTSQRGKSMPASVAQSNKGATNAQGGNGGNSGAAFKQSVSPTLRGPRADVERGSIWDVRLIRAGQSLNGPIYPPETLREAAESGVFEGVDVNVYKWGDGNPASGQIGHLESKVAEQDHRGLFGNVVGVIENVHFNEEDQALDGTLTLIDSTTREKMLEAFDAGKIGEAAQRNIFGFSIDAEGPRGPDGLTVLKISGAESLDIVTKPAAGGKTLRLVASADSADPGAEAAGAPAEEPLQEALVSVAPYVHPESGDGFAVFVAGRPVDWYPQRDQADRAAEIKDRLAVTEAETQETTMPQLKENAAKISAELKGLAEKISAASEDQVGPILAEVKDAVGGYMTDLGMGEAASPATVQVAAPASFAESDDFARMTAGLTEALKSDAVKSDSKLRESLETALGHKLEEDEKDGQIRSLRNRLTEQAISHAAAPFAENFHDVPTILKMISRESVTVSEDYSSVEGLKEAIEAFVKDRPHYRKAKEAVEGAPAPAAPQAGKPAVAPAAKPAAAAPAQEAQVPALGQAIPIRESLEDAGGEVTSMTVAAGKKKLAKLKKRMAKGITGAVVEHRNLRKALQAAGHLG